MVHAPKGKTLISIRLDDDVLAWFREQVHRAGGGSCQALINEALRRHIAEAQEPLEATLRRVTRRTRAGSRVRRKNHFGLLLFETRGSRAWWESWAFSTLGEGHVVVLRLISWRASATLDHSCPHLFETSRDRDVGPKRRRCIKLTTGPSEGYKPHVPARSLGPFWT